MKMKKNVLILIPSQLEYNALEDLFKKLGFEVEKCGVGVVHSAIQSYKILKKYKPEIVILTGLAGGYPEKGLCIGDIIIASKEIWADAGKKEKGSYNKLSDELEMITEITVSKDILNFFHMPKEITIKIGAMCTVCACSYEEQRAIDFSKKYNALAENMEGFGVALSAKELGIPFAEVRAISNLLGDCNNFWDIEKAFKNLSFFWKCQK